MSLAEVTISSASLDDDDDDDDVTAYVYSSAFRRFHDEVATFGVTEADHQRRTEGGLVERLIWVYSSPPIFVIGIVGNVLTVLVTARRPTRSTSSAVYLLCMSLAAIGVYLFGFLAQWLRAGRFVDVTELGPWSCRVNKFIYYSSGDVAIWTLSLLNVDRLVAVCLPLRKADVCTRRRAVVCSVVVLVVSVAKNLHLFWTKGTVYASDTSSSSSSSSGKVISSHCGAPHPHTHFETFVRPWIVFAFVTALPVVVVIACNTLIIRRLARPGDRILHARGGTGHTKKKKKKKGMTTMMCIGASLSFIFFSAPSIILVILKPYCPGPSYEIAKAVNNLLVHVNYAANFFLYCLGGRAFRSHLRLLLLCRRPRRGRAHFRSYRSTNNSSSARYTRSGNLELIGGTAWTLRSSGSNSSSSSSTRLSNL